MYTICRENVLQILQLAGIAKLSEVYDTFFTEMWNSGRKTRKSKGCIAHGSMTLPWHAIMSYSFMVITEIHQRYLR